MTDLDTFRELLARIAGETDAHELASLHYEAADWLEHIASAYRAQGDVHAFEAREADDWTPAALAKALMGEPYQRSA